jgi:hypothetical protein
MSQLAGVEVKAVWMPTSQVIDLKGFCWALSQSVATTVKLADGRHPLT